MLPLYEYPSLNIMICFLKKNSVLTLDSADKGSVKASKKHTAEAILFLNRILGNNFSLPAVKMREANSACCQGSELCPEYALEAATNWLCSSLYMRI